MSVAITKDNLKSVTQNQLTVVSFWAPWCGPCKMMKSVMQALETEFRGQIHFGRLNVSGNQKLAEKYHVFSIPSLVIFEHGRAHEVVTGYYSKPVLAKFLKQKLAEVKA